MKFAVPLLRSVVSLMLAAAGTASHAADTASLAFASGDSTRMIRIGAQWQWEKQWRVSEGVHIGGYWNLTLARWREASYRNTGRRRNITDIGITPVFRLQQDRQVGWYAEAGIGAHLLSELYDNGGRRLSTAFQFGDHIGVGYVTGTGLDAGLLLQHFSNCSIKKPNDGVNFAMLRIAYLF